MLAWSENNQQNHIKKTMTHIFTSIKTDLNHFTLNVVIQEDWKYAILVHFTLFKFCHGGEYKTGKQLLFTVNMIITKEINIFGPVVMKIREIEIVLNSQTLCRKMISWSSDLSMTWYLCKIHSIITYIMWYKLQTLWLSLDLERFLILEKSLSLLVF